MHTPFWKCPVIQHTLYMHSLLVYTSCENLSCLHIASPTNWFSYQGARDKMYVSEGDGDLRDSVTGN